jgi:hypothetical protein
MKVEEPDDGSFAPVQRHDVLEQNPEHQQVEGPEQI